MCVKPKWSEAALRSVLENPANDVFVREEAGETVGYVCVENVIDEGCVTSIAVAEAYRRRGIARELLTAALDASKMRSVYLEVNENNLPAVRLYESAGLHKIGERKKYYGDESAWIMRKEL